MHHTRPANLLQLSMWIMASILFLGCGKSEPPAHNQAIDVTVMVATPRDVPAVFEYVGQTQSSRQVNIQARINGFLDQRVYTEGSVVKAGQVLFLMDKKPFEAQVDVAEAQVSKSKAALSVAKANLDRVKPLTKADALSQKDLDNAIGNYQSASASLEAAKAQLLTAQLNLSYCTITSPVDGITGAAILADGSYVNQANSKLTTVAVLSPMWVNFSLSENQLQDFRNQVKKGLLVRPPDNNYTVEVVLVDGTIFPYTGHVTFTEPEYNTQTGTFLIRASVDNPDGVLHPNQYVRVHVLGATRPNAILVPQRAVQQSARGHFVWVVDKDNKAEMRPVTVGDWVGEQWHITEGLQEGDRVVVDGGLKLSIDKAVNPKPLTTPINTSASSAGTN